MTSKKIKIILMTAVAVFILGISVYFIFQFLKQGKIPEPQKEQTLVEKQLKELDELRAQAGSHPLSNEEIQKQLEELDEFRKPQLP